MKIGKQTLENTQKPDDPLIKTVATPMVRRLAHKGVRKRIDKIVTDIGLRPPLPLGKRRHEVQLDHGFRKYFNTMLRRAKVRLPRQRRHDGAQNRIGKTL